jgi:hypothetical protein
MADALDGKNEWVARVLGVSVASAQDEDEGSSAESEEAGSPPLTGMAAWKAARALALSTLKALESGIRAMKDPEGDQAIILLRAIQANLTAEPVTPQQMDELENYIMNDDIIEEAQDPNGFGITVELRVPLLAALASLRTETAATGSGRS